MYKPDKEINNSIDYSLVTESPSLKASQEQVARLYQRYCFARQFANGKDVIEVACGSGIGLGYLAKVARKVTGGDIDEKNVALAKKHYAAKDGNVALRIKGDRLKEGLDADANIDIIVMDAHKLNFSGDQFDLLLLYEAIYYLKESLKFVSEAERVLRRNGVMIVCSVNKDWQDFHPSPYTYKYFSVPEFYELFKNRFSKIEMYGGFPIERKGIKNKAISFIKGMAVDFNLIPGSLKARAYLKRIFMGKLIPLPDEVYEDMAPYESPVPIPVDKVNKDFKIIYAVVRK